MLYRKNNIKTKNISNLLPRLGEVEYDTQTKEWIELKSSLMIEKTYLPFFKLLNNIKKEKIKDVIKQRNSGKFTTSSSLLIKKLNKNITQIFHHFDCIKSNVVILFCTGEVENINQAVELYKNMKRKLYYNSNSVFHQI